MPGKAKNRPTTTSIEGPIDVGDSGGTRVAACAQPGALDTDSSAFQLVTQPTYDPLCAAEAGRWYQRRKLESRATLGVRGTWFGRL
jgi:hypothetical protein